MNYVSSALSTPDQPYSVTKRRLGVGNYLEAWILRNDFLIEALLQCITRQIMKLKPLPSSGRKDLHLLL